MNAPIATRSCTRRNAIRIFAVAWVAYFSILSACVNQCRARDLRSIESPQIFYDPAWQPLADETPAAPLPETEDSQERGDIDEVLDMDLETLSNASVRDEPTFSDPVVEGVSKKEEKLSQSPGIVDVITAEDIEQFGAKNLYEVLQRATSVFMTGTYLFRQNVASIRGNLAQHEDNHVLVLINGRPFRDNTLGGRNVTVYTAFPIHLIERVEVIRGPGSVLYGTNAFNGVINVVTKNPNEPMFHASTLNGTHGWQSYSVGGGSGNETQGALAGASYSRQEGFPFTATGENPPGPPPAQTLTAPWGEDNVGAFAMYRKNGFTANVFAARANHESLSVFNAWPSQQVDDPRVFCDLGYVLEIGDWQSLSVNFTYNYDGTTFPGSSGTPATFQSNGYLTEATYRAILTEDWNLLAGGTVDFHEGISGTGSPGIPQYNETWYGLYMQLEYQASDWLKLVGGMQANMPGEIEGGIVPRFGAIASLSEHWTGKFLYGQAFRSPIKLNGQLQRPCWLAIQHSSLK